MPPRKPTAGTATPKSRKRQLSTTTAATNNTPAASSPSGTRVSKRVRESAEKVAVSSLSSSSAAARPEKSKYDVEDDESSSEETDGSGHEDDDAASFAADDDDDDDDADEDGYDDSEEEGTSDKRKKRGPTKRSAGSKQNTRAVAAAGGNQHLWREGVTTGLGPGKQVFIEKPKPRGDGGVKYRPDRIHPNTILFLSELKENNDREWLKLHDPDYRTAWKDWESTVESLSEKISEVDQTIPELPAKDLVFRIYRDIRFSSDKTPYKTHFSAAWSRTGRKGPYAAYYVQIGPHGQSYVGSGLWMPEAQALARLRNGIDQDAGRRLRAILTDAGIRRHIFNGIARDETKAIKAFATRNAESALKTKPKGYAADNANIELLRLRSFTLGRPLSQEEVLAPNALSRIVELIAVMVPFVTYLNEVVMPDPEEEEGDDDDDDGDDDNTDNESDTGS